MLFVTTSYAGIQNRRTSVFLLLMLNKKNSGRRVATNEHTCRHRFSQNQAAQLLASIEAALLVICKLLHLIFTEMP
jgi:hypothetical protein